MLSQGVSNTAKLHMRLCNLYKFYQDYTGITLGLHQVCTGITHICNSRIGCNILVFRVIIRLKVQLAKQVQKSPARSKNQRLHTKKIFGNRKSS